MYLSTREGLKVVGIMLLIAAIIVLFMWLATWPTPAAALTLITIHGPDESEIIVNVQEISTIRQVLDSRAPDVAPNTHCVIIMANGKSIGVREPCIEVIRLISGSLRIDDN